jgi:hypothetical protein
LYLLPAFPLLTAASIISLAALLNQNNNSGKNVHS